SDWRAAFSLLQPTRRSSRCMRASPCRPPSITVARAMPQAKSKSALLIIPSAARANGMPNVWRASPPVPPPLRLTPALCGDLAQAERREWWIADGLGGYAGGTIAGSLTRRYHGLLIAPIGSPLGRRLLLAKADATVIVGTQSWPLFTNRWKSGAIAPAGH